MKINRASETSKERTEVPEQGPLVGELLDLYIALIVVIPLVLLLRSLWP